MLFFCRRGRQNLRELKKEDFSICTDSSGVRFVYKVKDELPKNRRKNDEAQESQTVFETGGPFCPVLSFEKTSLVLTRRTSTCFRGPRRQLMKTMKFGTTTWSLVNARLVTRWRSCLSKQSSPACTQITQSERWQSQYLTSAATKPGISCVALSGHRSESSIRSYASQTSLSTRRKMSETLSESLKNKKAVTTITATSSVGDSEIPVTKSAPELLLTASQEENILNEPSIEQSNTQRTVNNFYNCTFNY